MSSSAYGEHFQKNLRYIECALASIDNDAFSILVSDCEKTLRAGHKIIATGLGKNVPICEKFVGSMVSMGMDAAFLHTNSAVHGDMGVVYPGDLVIVLTKSGSTEESVYLVDLLQKREGTSLWLLSGNKESILTRQIENQIIFNLEREGDQWNVVPNNSTVVNLIILQELAMELAVRMGITRMQFNSNHPGGAIGEAARHGK